MFTPLSLFKNQAFQKIPKGLILLVPGTGVEPALTNVNMLLRHVRLPIPPPGRAVCKCNDKRSIDQICNLE